MYFLGVDGGGSKTAFVLISNEGFIQSRVTLGTCHYMQVGYDGFHSLLKEGIHKACSLAGIGTEEIAYGFFGLPGYGENEAANDLMDQKIRQILKSEFRCGNDSEAGWAGATGCKPGINIVSGTGSIAFGVDASGLKERAGGWGDFCGDEGSAYWISKKLIHLFAKQSDGRLEKTVLYDLLRNHLDLEVDFDLISILTETYQLKRDKVAALSLIATHAAELGDPLCNQIFEETAQELALCVKSLMMKLNFDEVTIVPVCYTGGVFESGELLLKPLSKALKSISSKLYLQKPLLSPDLGSAYYASLLFHKSPRHLILDQIVASQNEMRL